MTDEELRALVRDAIARHLGGPGGVAAGGRDGGPDGGRDFSPAGAIGHPAAAIGRPAVGETTVPPWRAHPSFGKFLVSRGDDEGGPCLIEPTVHCNHCGFCQSYGH